MRSCGATAPSPVRGRRRRRRSRVYGRCCRCAAFSPRESSSLEIASTSLDAAFAGVRLSKADLSRPISGHLAPPIGHPTGPRPAPVRVLHHSATRTTPRPACEASISSGPAIAASPAITQLDPDRQPAILSSPAISGSRPSYVARPSHAVRPDSSSPPSLAARTPRHALTTVPRHSLPVVPQHSTKPRAEFSLRLRGF